MNRAAWGLLIVFAAAGPAFGQDWPARPIRLIVPFSAGSSSDIVARIVAKATREVTAALADAGVRGALTEQGVEPEPGPPEALGDRMRADIAKWQDVIVSAGIHE